MLPPLLQQKGPQPTSERPDGRGPHGVHDPLWRGGPGRGWRQAVSYKCLPSSPDEAKWRPIVGISPENRREWLRSRTSFSMGWLGLYCGPAGGGRRQGEEGTSPRPTAVALSVVSQRRQGQQIRRITHKDVVRLPRLSKYVQVVPMYVRIYVCLCLVPKLSLHTLIHTYVPCQAGSGWEGGRGPCARSRSCIMYCRWMMRSHPETPKAVFVDECVLGEGFGLGGKGKKKDRLTSEVVVRVVAFGNGGTG